MDVASVHDDPALAILHGGGCTLVAGSTRLRAPAAAPPPASRIPGGHASAWAPRDPLAIVQYDYEGTPYAIPDPHPGVLPDLPPPRLSEPFTPAWDAITHQRKVQDIRSRIARGDCYQVNLAVPFTARLAAGVSDLAVFTALLVRSPAPFAGFIRRPGRPTVVSHSPECFLAWSGDRITSSPIKGTRRRDASRDAATRADLLASTKDRAELAMIVDLVRNDLGRVAAPGSVHVAEPARLMDLPYVHHLVADVTARLRPGITLPELLAAAFPAGSITGAPKRMAMAIIRELEGRPRGAYCGAFGWTAADAGQLAVAIRTAEIADDRITLWAGGGITADSDPAAEWDEVRAKAAGFATILGGDL